MFRLFEEAYRLCGHNDFVVIGSLSILGINDEDELPREMSMSIDVDAYTLQDPGRILDLRGILGEDSIFHAKFGYYLDPVSPAVASLPEGWESRMVCLHNDEVQIWFVDANDSAVSKYARADAKDLRWIRAGIRAGYISLSTVFERIRLTNFLDSEEEERVVRLVESDIAEYGSALRPSQRAHAC